MAQASFPITQFVLPDGTDLSDGYIVVKLNKDCQSTAGQVCAGLKVTVQLNGSGEPPDDVLFWTNSSLVPNDSVYIFWAYTSSGQLVSGPDNVLVTGTGPAPGTGFGVSFGTSFGS